MQTEVPITTCSLTWLWNSFLLSIAIGQGIGFVIRIAFRQDQASIPLYAVQQLVIVVSPAAYFAFNYILFGRLTYNMVRDARIHSTHSLTFFKPQHMGAIFVTSDVVTFIMQVRLRRELCSARLGFEQD